MQLLSQEDASVASIHRAAERGSSRKLEGSWLIFLRRETCIPYPTTPSKVPWDTLCLTHFCYNSYVAATARYLISVR